MHKFERTQAITLKTFSFKKRTKAYIKCMSTIYKGKELEEKDPDTGEMKKKPAANLMKIIDLESGELVEMIVPTLLLSTFCEKLDGVYEGKCYEIVVSAQPAEGKRYKTVEVYEIADPDIGIDAAMEMAEE